MGGATPRPLETVMSVSPEFVYQFATGLAPLYNQEPSHKSYIVSVSNLNVSDSVVALLLTGITDTQINNANITSI